MNTELPLDLPQGPVAPPRRTATPFREPLPGPTRYTTVDSRWVSCCCTATARPWAAC